MRYGKSVGWGRVETDAVAPSPGPTKGKLTGWQKSAIAGLLILWVPMGVFFYAVASVFAITAVFLPVSLTLIAVGTLPFSFAMKCMKIWRSG